MQQRYAAPTPQVLLRATGPPLQAITRLAATQSQALVNEYLAHGDWCNTHRDALCDQLYGACKRCAEDEQSRRLLLQAKRDVYNERPLPEAALIAAERYLEPPAYQILAEWQHRATRRRAILQLGEESLAQEVAHGRALLQESARDPHFQAAIALASRPLYEKLVRYTETPLAQQDGRLRKVETNLVAYLSRAATKTSPFSHFTSVTLGTWGATAGELLAVDPPTPTPRSQVQIGHLPLRHLQDAIQAHPALQDQIPLWVNPHQWVEGERRQIFLRRAGGPLRPRITQSTERITTLAESANLQAWLRAFQPGESLAAAVARLASPTLPAEKVRQMLSQMIEAGMLIRQLPLPEQSWDLLSELIAALRPIPVAPAPALVARLTELRTAYDGFEQRPAAERVGRLRAIEAALSSAFDLVGKRPAPDWLAAALYEDVTLEGSDIKLNVKLYERTKRDLLLLQRLVPLFDPGRLMRRLLTRAFVQLYGEGGRCTNLLAFYERCRKLLGSGLENLLRLDLDPLRTMATSPFAPPELPQIQALRQEFLQRVMAGVMTEAAEWAIPQEWLQDLVDRIPYADERPWRSYSYLAQVIASEEPRLLLNAIYDGYGHFYARFAALTGGLDPQANPLVQSLAQVQAEFLPAGEALAELLGVFGFNGCLHPPLTPYSLLYPSTWPAPDTPGPLRLDQVQIEHDPAVDRLRIRTASGVELHPVYLGLLVPFVTPPLYQFLLQFSGASKHELPLVDWIDAALPPERAGAIRTYPRICLGSLVLSRRRWVIPKALLPVRAPGTTDFRYLLQVNQWREALGLPAQLFIRANQPFWMSGGKGDGPSEAADGERKPQFIDFANPFLLRLFERHLGYVQEALLVEEMLPGTQEQALHLADGARVSEVLFEVNERGPERGAWQDG